MPDHDPNPELRAPRYVRRAFAFSIVATTAVIGASVLIVISQITP